MAKAEKKFGRVYTPDYLVRTILDFGGYKGKKIIGKHIIDNSCGDGAFLREIVERYCRHCQRGTLKKHLETYIHGIELDEVERAKCIRNLDEVAEKYGIKKIRWDVICADALCVDRHYGQMDYVFGNPPYVRVHNLDTSYEVVKKFSFAQQGMTDLFMVFFELGFKMLNESGKMCIITPSSWLSSKAGAVLRQYVLQHKNLSGIIDLGHFQPFEATTYTAISRFERSAENVELYRMSGETIPIEKIDSLPLREICIAGNFYVSHRDKLKELNDIKTGKAYRYVEVKNGFATLADKIFIGDFDFEGTIDVLKASTGRWCKCIFPYDSLGRPLPLLTIEKNKPLSKYLEMHKEELSKGRDVEKRDMWYLFGRTQAIKDVFKEKYALNTIIRDKTSIRLEKVGVGKGVYSGLYVLTDISEAKIRELIVSDDFVEYIRMLANYKSGGYYTFSSKDVEQFLNYKLSQQYGQSRISKGNLEIF